MLKFEPSQVSRIAIWYIEKGLHCIQTITDVGVFDLNRVVLPQPSCNRVLGGNVVHRCRKRNPNVRMGIETFSLEEAVAQLIRKQWRENNEQS